MKASKNLSVFQVVHGKWSDKTFGKRTTLGPLKHLEKEVQELLESPNDVMEYADCFMLLIDAARIAGISVDKLLNAVDEKFKINRNRKWGNPDEFGTVEHIRD